MVAFLQPANDSYRAWETTENGVKLREIELPGPPPPLLTVGTLSFYIQAFGYGCVGVGLVMLLLSFRNANASATPADKKRN